MNYLVNDIYDNSATYFRYIKVNRSRKPKLYPYIEINNNGSLRQKLFITRLSFNNKRSTNIKRTFSIKSGSNLWLKLIICKW